MPRQANPRMRSPGPLRRLAGVLLEPGFAEYHPGTLYGGGIALLFLALFIAGSYTMVRDGLTGVYTLDKTDILVAQLRDLPNKWRVEADRRFKNGEISGYQRQIEHARAESMRWDAERAADKILEIGDAKGAKLIKSAIGQAALSLVFSAVAPKVLDKLPASRAPTLVKKAAEILSKEIGKFGSGYWTEGTVKGVDAAQSLVVDQVISYGMDMATGKAPDLEKAFNDQFAGLQQLRAETQAKTSDDLMAAHLASVVNTLHKTKAEDPEHYQTLLERKAKKLDRFLSLTEANQRARGLKAKSPWKTTKDFQQWLAAQVVAREKVEQEKQIAGDLNAVFAAGPVQGKAPLTVSFDASGSTGKIESYRWDFGDKESDSGKRVDHIYQSAGSFDATLTVTGPQNITRTTTRKITVLPKAKPAVTVSLGLSPTVAKPRDTVTIVVNPQVTNLEEGELVIIVDVNGREIFRQAHSGDLTGDLSKTGRYRIAAKPATTNYTVTARVELKLPEAMQKALDKRALSASAQKSFRVEIPKKKVSPLEAFKGAWRGTFIVQDPDNPMRGSYYMHIAIVDEHTLQVTSGSSMPGTEEQTDNYTVQNGTATFSRRFVEEGLEHQESTRFSLTGENQLSGSSVTRVYDLEQGRQHLLTLTMTFRAIRTE